MRPKCVEIVFGILKMCCELKIDILALNCQNRGFAIVFHAKAVLGVRKSEKIESI